MAAFTYSKLPSQYWINNRVRESIAGLNVNLRIVIFRNKDTKQLRASYHSVFTKQNLVTISDYNPVVDIPYAFRFKSLLKK